MKLLRPLVLSTALLAAASAPAAIVITEVMSASGHQGGAGNGDWFELYNSGVTGVDLTGWSWDDNTNLPGSHIFGAVTIPAGGYLIVVEETTAFTNFWRNNVWGITNPNVVIVGNDVGGFSGLGATAAGDAVNIYNAANALVTSVTFGLATTGVSFEWDQLGNSLSLSVAGQNGAYVALKDGNDNLGDDNPALYGPGSDVASPGFAAIPEPAALSFLLVGASTASLWRRRKSRSA